MAGKDNNGISRVNKNNNARKTTKPAGKSKSKGKKVGWILFFTGVFAVFCALAGYLFIMVSGEKLLEENKDKLTAYGTSKVYDRNGQLMGELSIQKSDPVDIDQIPELLQQAFIATEDKRFYDHSGVDIWSIGRAAVKDIMARAMVEGGSTITQQLAKNIFLTRDKTFFRKATEVSIALALERQHTKDEIMEMYLNRINFGGPYYGIKAASQHYFGKSDLNELELWEMATLAAMPKGPSKYNPIRNPELSMERRAVVLTLMEQQGYISAADAEKAKKVEYTYEPPATQQKYTAFIDYVIEEAEEKYGLTEDDLNIGGYSIYTTMDASAQQAVEDEFNNDSNFEKGVGEDIVQGSMVIMNQHNGSIVAISGGRNYQRASFNRAFDSKVRQPGSSLKPVAVYAPALESDPDLSKDTRITNEKQCFGEYCPNNLNGYSQSVSMAEAIQRSENIPAVWMLNKIGVKTGFQFAQKLGISVKESDQNLSLALGATGTNTFEMARAFTSFANGGELKEAYAIKQIQNSNGKVIHENKGNASERVMSPETASEMTDMLQLVVNEGTGKNARISRPVAGKTGTTQSGITGVSGIRDVWFVGYTPELTAAVWMGYDNPSAERMLKQSSPMAAALWGKIMEKAVQNYDPQSFPVLDQPQTPVEPEQPELSAVRNLSGYYNEEANTVNLTWSASEVGGAEYRVYRKEASEADYTRVMNELAGTSTDDISVLAGLTYSYYVTAYDPESDQESEPSNTVEVVITGPAPPEEEPEAERSDEIEQEEEDREENDQEEENEEDNAEENEEPGNGEENPGSGSGSGQGNGSEQPSPGQNGTPNRPGGESGEGEGSGEEDEGEDDSGETAPSGDTGSTPAPGGTESRSSTGTGRNGTGTPGESGGSGGNTAVPGTSTPRSSPSPGNNTAQPQP